MGLFNITFIITTGFYLYIVSRLLDSFLGKKKYKTKFILLMYLLFYISTITTYFIFKNPFVNFSLSISLILVMTIAYDANWKNKLFFALLAYILLFACEELTYVVLQKINLKAFIDNSEVQGVLALLMSRMIAYMLALILSRKRILHTNYKLPFINWIAIFAIPVSTVFLTSTILINYKMFSNLILILAICALFIVNTIAFFIYDHMCISFSAFHKKNMMKKEIESYKRQLDLIFSSQEKNTAILHDMKNHLAVVDSLITHNDKISAKAYISKINIEISNISNKIYTGNLEIDSILNYKVNQAKNHGTSLNIKCNIQDKPQSINILSFDLNIILGNLLDNAIDELKESSSENIIDLYIELNKSIIIIKSKNYTFNAPIYENGELVTSKGDKDLHGYGLKNIRNAISKYNGELSINYENNIFEAIVLLYN